MMKLEIEVTKGIPFMEQANIIFIYVHVYRQMKTIMLPIPPGVRIGGTKTTVQVPVDTPTEPSSNATRKRFLTLLCDGSGFCKYPIFIKKLSAFSYYTIMYIIYIIYIYAQKIAS